MSKAIEPSCKVKPITAQDIDKVSVFLHQHMSNKFSATQWATCLETSWLSGAPNHGSMLETESGEVVGALCAIYSTQNVAGDTVNFCNPHSWCVLPEYRKSSVQLVLYVIRQKDFHFTMFSPNKSGLEIFSYLRFKPLESSVSTLVNVPLLRKNSLKFGELNSALEESLPTEAKQVYDDHKKYPWLNFLLCTNGKNTCFIVYKVQKYKKLPSVNILYISDRQFVNKYWPDIRSYFLMSKGIFSARVESRFIEAEQYLSLSPEKGQQKFYLSPSLLPEQIENLYSELAVLDL